MNKQLVPIAHTEVDTDDMVVMLTDYREAIKKLEIEFFGDDDE